MNVRALRSRAAGRPLGPAIGRAAARRLPAAVAIASLGLAAIVAARRGAGALQRPLPVAGWMALAVFAALAWRIVRTAGGPTAPPHDGAPPPALARGAPQFAVLAAALVALAAALWLPGTSLWGPLVVATAVAASELVCRLSPTAIARTLPGSNRPESSPLAPTVAPPSDAGDVAPRIMQRFVRQTTAAGRDELRGRAAASFAAGQRTAHLHVAFCPPFVAEPRAEFAQVSGPEARIRLGLCAAYGLRLEVKLREPAAAATTVEVELAAASPPTPP